MKARAAGLFLVLVGAPARADAQWFASVAFGGNHTTPATVSIRPTSPDTSLDFHDVTFQAKALKSPQYYNWHIGRFLGSSGRIGIELEFIHLKVIADVSRSVRVTGRENGIVIDEVARMDTRVQEYQMTHGLNFVMANLVYRMPLGAKTASGSSRFVLLARVGAGETIPHAETSVYGKQKELYEWAGPGVGASIGMSYRIHGRFSAVADYKLTHAKPKIPLADGKGQTTAVTHQVAFGLAIGLPR